MSPEQKNILFRLAAAHSCLMHYVDVSLGNASRIFPTFMHSSVEIWMSFIIFNGDNATSVEVIKIHRLLLVNIEDWPRALKQEVKKNLYYRV